FSWGPMQYDFDFLPRLCYNDVVLSRARWNITEDEIKEITSYEDSNAIKAIKELKEKRQFPDVLAFVQGDNEVIINFNNDLSCEVLFAMMKGEKLVELKEFLFKEDTITKNYCNEFIVPAFKKAEENKKELPVFVSK